MKKIFLLTVFFNLISIGLVSSACMAKSERLWSCKAITSYEDFEELKVNIIYDREKNLLRGNFGHPFSNQSTSGTFTLINQVNSEIVTVFESKAGNNSTKANKFELIIRHLEQKEVDDIQGQLALLNLTYTFTPYMATPKTINLVAEMACRSDNK